MDKFCTVPTGFDAKNFTYETCGLPAAYEIGSWLVCEGHKKHYCDPNKWFGNSLKGEGDNGKTS